MDTIHDNEENQKRKTATALGYDPDHDGAPVVVASGRGKIAEQIIAAARENNIPIHSDPSLAESLGRVNINQAIPPELYIVVAEIFAYIYRIKAQQIRQKGITTNGK
jgi:flagellar biosynthesis protein